MATPRNNAYAVASGQGVYAGRPSVPWAADIPIGAWTAIPGAQTWASWAATGIPNGSYNGTSPKNAILDAYCDPAGTLGAQYFYGGGHGDGSCNAVVKLDHLTMQFSLVGQPTPPSRYPPSYANGGSLQPGPLVYPSGAAGNGFFLDSDVLTATEDQPYTNPMARASSHMYAAAAMRGTKVFYFYATYAEFDTATGLWSGRGVDIGAQLYAINPNLNNVPLQQGTVAMYDDVTDRFYVTLNPGDGGGGWRSHIIEWNPTTRQIVTLHNPGSLGIILNSVNFCRVGRKLFIFLKTGVSSARDMTAGLIFDMDTKAFSKFVLTGDTAGSFFNESPGQETIPSWYDGHAIRRWNYNATYRGKILSVNPTPISGAGTSGSPYVLQQTEITVANAPTDAYYVYKRAHFDQRSGCVILFPRSTTAPVALRLA